MGWLDIFRSKPAPTPIREVAPTARQIAAVRLQENVNNYPDFFDSLMDRYWSNGQWWFPIDGIPSIGGSQNKTRGLDRYVFNTDQQLRLQRDAARILYAREPVAKTIEGHLNAFVIGKGFKYTVKPKKDYQEQITPEQLRQYQEYFDQWSDAEQWPEREQECYTSKFVDGEFFLRVTVYKGAVRTRRLEPEHIQDPPGMSFVDGWFLGVKFAPDDMETPLAYGYKVEGKDWEEIPAKEVIHYKANVTRNVSRGISDLYPVLDDVKSIAQLSDNVREGAAARAEIAYMWSIKNATPAAVSRFADEQKDRSSYNSLTLKTDRSKGMKSGKAVAHGDNVEYTTMPQGDVEGSIAALQAALRMVGGRWCLPEYMTSADASNGNYASTQVAGGPFVRFVEREQNLLKRPFKQVYDLVMKQAVVSGVIPTSEYAKLDIQVDCDSPVIEDKYQQAQMYEIERRNGVLSPQQWCAMAGRDYEDTQRDINEWNESNMQAAPAMGGTGAGGLFGGQQQGANNDTIGEEGQETGEAEGTSDQGDEEGRSSGAKADSQKPVKENWDEDKHPRDNIGQFASKGGEGEKKKGSTGEVIIKDGKVYKNATRNEGKVYAALKGIEGVANGEEIDGKIVTDFYKNIVSVDEVPFEKRKSLAPVVDKAYSRLVNAITALSDAGYTYNDPLQVGFNEKREAHLFDFSMSQKTTREEAIDDNLQKLSQYMEQFGNERKAKAITHVNHVYRSMNDVDNPFMEDEPETKDAKKILSHLDGKKANYLYYSTNGRTIPDVAQSESRDGLKVIASETPLDDKFMSQWEITPVIHAKRSKDKSQGKPKRGEFGYGSKAVDSKGRLLELYHGSEHDFDEFKITGNSDGLFFSVNKPTAGDRTGESRDEWKHQYTVHLDIKNPIQVSSKILIDPDADDPWQAYVDNENSVMQDAKEQGYDGMRIDDNVWIAFSPSQVKLIKKEAL